MEMSQEDNFIRELIIHSDKNTACSKAIREIMTPAQNSTIESKVAFLLCKQSFLVGITNVKKTVSVHLAQLAVV